MSFKAYLISQEDGKVVSRFTEMNEDQLDPGEVTIRVAYSSVNYKDALAATGAGRIIRRFPCIGGIDLAGTVVTSRDPRFSEGDVVLGTGHEVGVAHHGGYAELARMPADWVLKLPAGMTLKGAMEFGTAGFAAALAVVRGDRGSRHFAHPARRARAADRRALRPRRGAARELQRDGAEASEEPRRHGCHPEGHLESGSGRRL